MFIFETCLEWDLNLYFKDNSSVTKWQSIILIILTLFSILLLYNQGSLTEVNHFALDLVTLFYAYLFEMSVLLGLNINSIKYRLKISSGFI